ncbi:MAG: hypothetical protein A2Y15_03295 [Clostridiales bacterium GWF2_36_10]|nr:MAG: hypothetical protein A2Y15_03295 [Clostridiales bacterium GWF2_36_10]HAN20156.1 hypothetical protein [Clostridiales bacterium]
MKLIEEKIFDCAKKSGIDLLGFAPKERFDKLPASLNPFSIFPEGKTVIMLGKRICRGSLRGVEEGTNFIDYGFFGADWLEDEFLSVACYDLTRAIEDEGWEAVPVFPNPSEVKPQGVAVSSDRPVPNVFPDFAYAAVAAGVAEISYNDILFSESLGSRQRFHMIITDAELMPTPILEKSVCDGCLKCVEICPLKAISKTEFNIIEICGKQMKVAKIDYEKCKKCGNGAVKNRLSPLGKPDRIAALCNRTCISHLEKIKLISNIFDNNFRQREAWGKDISGNNVEVSSGD